MPHQLDQYEEWAEGRPHARNPFKAPGSGTDAIRGQLQEITDSMWRLLKAHTLDTGSPGYLLLGHFD